MALGQRVKPSHPKTSLEEISRRMDDRRTSGMSSMQFQPDDPMYNAWPAREASQNWTGDSSKGNDYHEHRSGHAAPHSGGWEHGTDMERSSRKKGGTNPSREQHESARYTEDPRNDPWWYDGDEAEQTGHEETVHARNGHGQSIYDHTFSSGRQTGPLRYAGRRSASRGQRYIHESRRHYPDNGCAKRTEAGEQLGLFDEWDIY
ncbi:uncharacterized protein I303_107321 [Kwoniella dejecticola CBS 10117]|uniref:Uncharacterized protein n=1 Tax=Kwoniella dejecticola CBS 10117 TaxID=1296121 RepID=A0A1A5ZZF3_9TREE|nr:uncharacterized protein I303_06724 [Kwoniella dejecticola CBS 10117]OBR83165.1 hypothetical protein I303_06724 [Kwoniella dejecticola CBS 10117]